MLDGLLSFLASLVTCGYDCSPREGDHTTYTTRVVYGGGSGDRDENVYALQAKKTHECITSFLASSNARDVAALGNFLQVARFITVVTSISCQYLFMSSACKLIQTAGRGEISPSGLHAITVFLDMFMIFSARGATHGDQADRRLKRKSLLQFAYANGLVGVVSLTCLPQVCEFDIRRVLD